MAISGGGPAGLAVAIQAASRGLSTIVLERRREPLDKACGEGLMPAGVRGLEALGVRDLLRSADCKVFEGIRYVQEDGSFAEGRLPRGGGLGIRRIALVEALARRAKEVGVEVRHQSAVRSHHRAPGGVRVETEGEDIEAQILVAADGIASPLRRAEGLDAQRRGPKRFGLRRHFRVPPWTSFVEVYLSPEAEAYVTPIGDRVGVAFLWDDARFHGRVSIEALTARFPALASRLEGAEFDSAPRGAGPLARSSRARTAERFALVGDAAGYLDAITGEGLSLAFSSAEALGRILPEAVAQGGTRRSLLPYEREYRRLYRRYEWVTRAVLAVARHPGCRRPIIKALSRQPRIFERLLEWFAG